MSVIPSRRGLRRSLGKGVVVHTIDDKTLEGILVGVWVDTIAVRHGRLLQIGDVPDVPLGGDAVIPMSNVSIVQVIVA